MTEWAFEKNRNQCELPEIEKIGSESIIQDCGLPEPPDPIRETPEVDLPVPPPVPDCPQLEIRGQIGYGSLGLDISGGLSGDLSCPGECRYEFDLNLTIPEYPYGATGFGLQGIPGPHSLPERPLTDAVGLVAIDMDGNLIQIPPYVS